MFDLLPLRNIEYCIHLMLYLSVHEWAHAYSAWKLGDDTASREGRLTLNPLAHIDPIGTVLLPLLGVPFGWARPVPVNPARFRRSITIRHGMVITAAAGPASNLAMALIATIGYGLYLRFVPSALVGDGLVARMVSLSVILNVVLAIFNMLPIPPLDGSRVADGLMPARYRPQWERFMQYGGLVLAFVIVAPLLLGFSFLSYPVQLAQHALYSMAFWIAGYGA